MSENLRDAPIEVRLEYANKTGLYSGSIIKTLHIADDPLELRQLITELNIKPFELGEFHHDFELLLNLGLVEGIPGEDEGIVGYQLSTEAKESLGPIEEE